MSEEPKLLIKLENGIKRITFNRPQTRNAVDPETFELFHQAMLDSAHDESRVIVLTGAGESFCSGADLSSFQAMDTAQYDVTTSLRERTNPAILAMRAMPKPIIARVHGPAAGIGCNYALACDIIIASEQAYFAELFVRIGLMPDGGGTYFFPRMVGYHKAFELMALGEIVPAPEAARLGIANKCVPLAELDATVNAIAERLAAAPAIAVANIKAGLNHALNSDLAAALEFEAVHQAECFHSADFREGVAAFLEKRKAVFTGK
ncbi:MAG TPA: enoyl-CoA hydratase [Blastocatellia bacterium]|nr:enoyl-CoA hydratase [Blastocatellia bacterium]